jgi:predicted O-methyltransferase YrrM
MLALLPVFDLFFLILYAPACAISWIFRRIGAWRLPLCSKVTHLFKVLPIRSHYYEPAFHAEYLETYHNTPRDLPQVPWQEGIERGITWILEMRNSKELLKLGTGELSKELTFIPEAHFNMSNGSFEKADAEVLYLFLRKYKPRNIIEVGSGNSTKVMLHAVKINVTENSQYESRITCIEPFEAPFLEATGVNVVRKKVENCDLSLFENLNAGDLLFIDSSHVIKPGGDILFLYQSVIPRLKPGVFVHIHDIFIPFDYPKEWVRDRMWLWNEQYVLEGLLAQSNKFEIVCPLNAIVAMKLENLNGSLPWVKKSSSSGAGSFWFKTL